MHILVTGAAGFIAARTVELLLAAGHTVTGLDNLNPAYDVRLKEWRLQQLVGQPGFEFHRADITQLTELRQLWAAQPPFGAVINLAARAGVRQSVENPWVYYETNLTGTLNLLEQCRQHAVGKFVLASTSSLYGAHNPMPYGEEADTSRPLSPYAA
jgi:nucleoside-diphosphate-sugar epimerase